MRTLIFASALLASSSAFAGSLTFSATTGSNVCPTVTAPSGGATATRCIVGDDSQLARVVAAAKTQFNIPGATNAQILIYLANWWFGEVRAMVQKVEQDAAAQSASDAVAPVNMQ